jgi:hypothetical protein
MDSVGGLGHPESAMNTSARNKFGGLVSFAGIVLGCAMLVGLLVWNTQRPGPSPFLDDLLGNSLFFGGAALGVWVYTIGKRMRQLSAAEATARDPRPPILLLRSFSDDHSLRVRKSGLLAGFNLTAVTGKTATFEEVLVKVFAAFGPVLAIGRPGEALPPVGAARAYVPEGKDWKEEVRALAKRSAWIVMVLGSSEGFCWELEMVLGLGSPEKVVIVLPPLSAGVLQPRWETLRQEFRNHGLDLPSTFDPETVLLRFSKQWEPAFSLGRGLIRVGWLGSGMTQYEKYLRDALAGVVGQNLPHDGVGAPPAATAPSPAVTTLLVLLGWGLWLAVLGACFLLLQQFALCSAMQMALPMPAKWLFGFSWWRWFNQYWWLVVLGLVVLAPITRLTTYWVRHRLRSRLLAWAWGALFLVPPLLLLGMAAFSMSAIHNGILQQIRADSDDAGNYLNLDGTELRFPLKLREVRQGVAGPEGEIILIEPAGNWQIVPGIRGWERPPLRQGKLTTAQLTLLAHHLARQKFLAVSRDYGGMTPRTEPPPNLDSLSIEFGDASLTLEFARRDRLQQVRELQPGEGQLRSVIVPLVLVIDDLVKGGAPD